MTITRRPKNSQSVLETSLHFRQRHVPRPPGSSPVIFACSWVCVELAFNALGVDLNARIVNLLQLMNTWREETTTSLRTWMCNEVRSKVRGSVVVRQRARSLRKLSNQVPPSCIGLTIVHHCCWFPRTGLTIIWPKRGEPASSFCNSATHRKPTHRQTWAAKAVKLTKIGEKHWGLVTLEPTPIGD